jgi:hypothetical protein
MMSPGPKSESVELFDAAHEVVGLKAAENLIIDEGYWGKAAGAEAVDDFDGEAVVGGGGAGIDASGLLDGLDGLGGAANVAGGSVADTEKVLAAAFEVELGVEGGDAVELGEGDEGAFGDELEGGLGEIAKEVLGHLQDGDDGTFLTFEFVEDALELIDLGRVELKIGVICRRDIRNHNNLREERLRKLSQCNIGKNFTQG